MRVIIFGVAALAWSSAFAFEQYDLQPADVDVVKAAIVKILKDPESARFGKMDAVRTADDTVAVCGLVNAKNSFGGYGGDSPFIGELTAGKFNIQVFGDGEVKTTQALGRCSNLGATDLF